MTLGLADMHWHQTGVDQRDGVTLITGTFRAFGHPFPVAGNGVKTLPWRQVAMLFLPEHPGGSPTPYGVLYNCHDMLEADAKTHLALGRRVCQAFRIPVMIHGWAPDVVSELEGTTYHSTQASWMRLLLASGVERAEDLPDDLRFVSPLPKGDMVAISLLQRLALREAGLNVDEVGSLGISKEGGAHWILGAIDDRVTVVAPGGCIPSTRDLMACYREDWNFELPPEFGEPDLFHTFWRYLDWAHRTEAGRALNQPMEVAYWPDAIKARDVLISGDLGLPGQHDRAWPVLAERQFFDTFSHSSWHYVRAFDGSGLLLGDRIGEMGIGLLYHVAYLLTNGTRTPSTPTVTVTESGRRLRIEARSRTSGDHEAEALLFTMISSSRNRRLPGTVWQRTPMPEAHGEPGCYASPLLPSAPLGHSLTFIVAVRERVEQGGTWYWRSASTLPEERFPLPRCDGRLPRWDEDT